MYYYTLFVVFVILISAISVDPNLAEYILLLPKFVKIKFKIFKWWLFNNPSNPLVAIMIRIRSEKMAKELLKELRDGNKIER